MKIVIDIQSVIGQKTGVGKYTEGLIRALSRLSSPHRFIFFYFNFRSRFKGLSVEADNVTNKGIKLPGRFFNFLWKKGGGFSFDRLSGQADLFHFPNFICRPVSAGKIVVTVHDLAFRRFPEHIEKKNLVFLNNNLSGTLFKADKIIAVSKFTKEELLKFYPIPEEKIRVIYEGIDSTFRKIEDKERLKDVKDKYRLPDNFFLWVGTLEPRKNMLKLLESFAVFKGQTKADWNLVLVGRKGWNYRVFSEKLKKLFKAGEVILTEYVSDIDLPFIYNLSKAFVFPSIYEGFGLPPLEAMACGVPVITTQALSEVTEEAALKVSHENIQEMAEAMKALWENTALRKNLIQKGLKQAGKFSWEKAAGQTLSLYEAVMRGE